MNSYILQPKLFKSKTPRFMHDKLFSPVDSLLAWWWSLIQFDQYLLLIASQVTSEIISFDRRVIFRNYEVFSLG